MPVNLGGRPWDKDKLRIARAFDLTKDRRFRLTRRLIEMVDAAKSPEAQRILLGKSR